MPQDLSQVSMMFPGIGSILGDNYNCVRIHNNNMQQQQLTTTTTMYCFLLFHQNNHHLFIGYPFLLPLLILVIAFIILSHDSSMSVCQHWNQHQAQADKPCASPQ